MRAQIIRIFDRFVIMTGETGTEWFAHCSAFPAGVFRSVKFGDRVEFSPSTNFDGRPRAEHLRILPPSMPFRGIVTRMFQDAGYAFLRHESDASEAFLHAAQFAGNFDQLRRGDVVEFDQCQGRKPLPEAVHARLAA